MATRLAELGRSAEWCCPMLPVSPLETIALAESLAATAAAPVTVIGSSLGGVQELMKELLGAGAKSVLTKPFDAEKVLAVLDGL